MPTIVAPLLASRQRSFDTCSTGPFATPNGTTKVTGSPAVPVRRKVRLYSQHNGRLVQEMWSDPTSGQYGFKALRAGAYFVVAFDHTQQYNGEIMTDVVLPAPGA